MLLARAVRAMGDDGKAALIREEAWNEYVSAPRFQRRVERRWAWRARPSRPITYAVLIVIAGALFTQFAAPTLMQAAGRDPSGNSSP